VATTVVMSFFGLSLVRDVRWLFLLVAAVYLTRYVRASAARPAHASVGAAATGLSRSVLQRHTGSV
jgi:hypothetical protein